MIRGFLSRKFVVYLLVGVFSAAIDVFVFQFMMYLDHSVNFSLLSSFLSGIGINYIGHTNFTFRVRFSCASFARYLAVVVLNYFLAFFVVWACVIAWDNPLLGKLISLPVVALNGYHLGRKWIFPSGSV